MTDPHTVRIDPRFRGPPRSGNGGYSCGVVGMRLPGIAAVRLLAPPPLDVDLQLREQADGTLGLWQGDAAIAQARSGTLDLEVPAAPTLAEAQEATTRFAGFAAHPFPGCFVCGPQRAEGDGLRIFPAAVRGHDLVAAPWQPAGNLADRRGQLHPEFVWSALDCTGFFSFGPLPDGSPALLGELTTRIDHPVAAGAPHIVTGWLIESSGRKHIVGSAVFADDGTLLACARATWIVVPQGTAGAVA